MMYVDGGELWPGGELGQEFLDLDIQSNFDDATTMQPDSDSLKSLSDISTLACAIFTGESMLFLRALLTAVFSSASFAIWRTSSVLNIYFPFNKTLLPLFHS
jgi:uncharacterized membrane protein YccC